MMKSLVMAVFLTLFTVALLVGMPVIAQDEPLATNTPDGIQVTATINGVPVDATLEPTSELPVVVVNQPAAPNDNAIYAVGFIVLMGFAALFTYVQNRQLSTLMGTVSKVLDNKQVIDEGHRLYMESSLSVQNVVTLIQGVASYLGTVIPGEDLAEIIARGITNVKNPPASVPFEAGPNGTVYKVVPQVEFQGGRGAEPILGNNLPPTPDQNDPVG